jgi:hypothetical protein
MQVLIRRLLRLFQPSELTAGRAGLAVAIVTVVVTVAAGLVIWLFDREEFRPSAAASGGRSRR